MIYISGVLYNTVVVVACIDPLNDHERRVVWQGRFWLQQFGVASGVATSALGGEKSG